MRARTTADGRAHRPVTTPPTPALVTQLGARPLPRWALWLLGCAYVLPGVFGRDPWRNADLSAFGVMVAIAEGRSGWLAPTLGGVAGAAAVAPLPHWLGASFIVALSPWVDAALAARIPSALLLALALALVRSTAYQLARTEAAQPIPLAFGGEAEPAAYAHAIGDAAVLALIASLGLLQLGHETTPELAQLFGVALAGWALAAAPFRPYAPAVAIVAAQLTLAGSGAPTLALASGLVGSAVCRRSSYPRVRRYAATVIAASLAGAILATALGAWQWRVQPLTLAGLRSIVRQWGWFLWPCWPLVLWTLWRWRRHWLHRHVAVPLTTAAVALAANVAMKGLDRALMLALPGMAVLAAFALPTLRRSASAAIDWFSVCFFTVAALTIWVIYASLQIGVPAKPAANVMRLAPGFVARLSVPELLIAAAGTLGWFWLVRWRSGRHRAALWKSLVLPAGGVALCWLLLMTLWLPLLDYARSSRPLVGRLAAVLPPGHCIAGPELPQALVAALEYHGDYLVDARPQALDGRCDALLRVVDRPPLPPVPPGWTLEAELRRPTDRTEITALYRRRSAKPSVPGP
jgi:hypothetical protein